MITSNRGNVARQLLAFSTPFAVGRMEDLKAAA
jgi:hypothetical protein